MGLDMYLTAYQVPEQLVVRMTPEKILELVSHVKFLESYEELKELNENFDQLYKHEDFFTVLGESLIEKKNRIRESVAKAYKEMAFEYDMLSKWYDPETFHFAKKITSEEVGYWRKANQIHNWFVKNVQAEEDNCQPYVVTKEQIEELHSICFKVIKNKEKAPVLLETKNGFFFGGTDYDDWYFEDVQETIEILDNVLKNINFNNSFLVYQSSW